MASETVEQRYERIRAVISEDEVLELTRRLVAVDTVTGNERQLAGALLDHLCSLGLEARTSEFAPGRPNVYGHLRGAGTGPTVLLLGHVDTVGVGSWEQAWPDDGRADAWAGTVADGSLWGLGAADEKGGIAAILSALGALRRLKLPPAGDVVVAFVGDEESGQPGTGLSAGTRALVEELRSGGLPSPDFAVYTEPTQLDVYAAQPGFLIATIAVHGSSSYFAFPWRGRDAIRGAARLLEALYAYEATLWGRGRHPSVGRPVLVVTGIHGGESVAVPERCELSLIRTLLPSETLEDARDELEDLLRRLAIEDGIDCQVSFTAARDHPVGGTPFETDPEGLAVRLLQRCSAVESPAAEVTGAPYWSELPLLADLGIPGVYFGPGDISACHTPLEHVPVGELARAARCLATFLASGEEAAGRLPDFDHRTTINERERQ